MAFFIITLIVFFVSKWMAEKNQNNIWGTIFGWIYVISGILLVGSVASFCGFESSSLEDWEDPYHDPQV